MFKQNDQERKNLYHEKRNTWTKESYDSERGPETGLREQTYPIAPATELKKDLEIAVSVENVRRALWGSNLNARSPRKVALLTKQHLAKRLKFAKEHVDWPASKWRNVLWTDENKIVLFGASESHSYVRRPVNCEYNPRYTKKKQSNTGPHLLIWAFPLRSRSHLLDQNYYGPAYLRGNIGGNYATIFLRWNAIKVGLPTGQRPKAH